MTGVSAWQDSVPAAPGDSAWFAQSSLVVPTAPFERAPEYHAPLWHYGVAVAVVALAAFWLWQTRGGRRR